VSSHRRRDRAIQSVLAEYKHQQTGRTDRKDRRMTGPTKLKTAGLHPKVPAQAVATLAVAALAYYGIDLDAELAAALGVVLGFGAGVAAPAATSLPDRSRASRVRSQAGHTLPELIVGALLFLVFLAFCVWILRVLL
jgi:hypothetical protein